ncbi:MAG: TetR/AcrR family transcriptional regulator [Rhodospirillales bacterium]|nr:MAG: TetR/AcrR family transcriptional regulator [Rhodospirillales bacterium]
MRTSAIRASSRVKIESQTDDAGLIERRRSQLVAAAAQCFGANGFHRTTIKDIAEVAGFSPGLVYTYVREKEDVLFLVIVSLLENYAREIPEAIAGKTDPLDRFCAAVETYCRAVGRNVGATALAYRETKSLSRGRQKVLMQLELSTNKMISDCLDGCIRAGYFRAVNLDLVTYRIVLLAHGWALKAWHFKRITTLEGYIKEGLDLFLHALLTKAGWRRLRTLGRGESVATVVAARECPGPRRTRKAAQ